MSAVVSYLSTGQKDLSSIDQKKKKEMFSKMKKHKKNNALAGLMALLAKEID